MTVIDSVIVWRTSSISLSFNGVRPVCQLCTAEDVLKVKFALTKSMLWGSLTLASRRDHTFTCILESNYVAPNILAQINSCL